MKDFYGAFCCYHSDAVSSYKDLLQSNKKILAHMRNKAETEEHGSLVRALALIREGISQVDTQVSEYEKATRRRDIAQRLEPKSQGRLKDGRLFSREDLLDTTRTLLRDTTVTLKANSGRLKDIHAVLLTDVLFLLQEKDQKLVFSTVVSHTF
ncbi:hypothetical protein CRUP_014394 [Coryphaenoides rupestris]|nr:hypothetical protein CRUP_014394 [Coryphaenoides rupestris]